MVPVYIISLLALCLCGGTFMHYVCIMLVQFSVESTGSILLMCMHYVIWIMCMHLSCLVLYLVYLEISTVYYYIYYYTNS